MELLSDKKLEIPIFDKPGKEYNIAQLLKHFELFEKELLFHVFLGGYFAQDSFNDYKKMDKIMGGIYNCIFIRKKIKRKLRFIGGLNPEDQFFQSYKNFFVPNEEYFSISFNGVHYEIEDYFDPYFKNGKGRISYKYFIVCD